MAHHLPISEQVVWAPCPVWSVQHVVSDGTRKKWEACKVEGAELIVDVGGMGLCPSLRWLWGGCGKAHS